MKKLWGNKTKKLVIGCVADNKQKYQSQALRFVQSLESNKFIKKEMVDYIVVTLGDFPNEYVSAYKAHGAAVYNVEKIHEKHGPSNKLSFFSLDVLKNYDYVMLCDCDTIVVGDICSFLNFEGIQAKIADTATLAGDNLKKVFDYFNKELPIEDRITSIDQKKTPLYCNSGVIIFFSAILNPFVRKWKEYNDTLLSNIEILDDRSFFCDQASFSLTLDDFVSQFKELPLEMNFPTHFPLLSMPHDAHTVIPKIIHYHDKVDDVNLLVMERSTEYTNRLIQEFNCQVLKYRITHDLMFDFWEGRHTPPNNVSDGIGSKSLNFGFKNALISYFLENKKGALLDLGCGSCAYWNTFLSSDIKYYGFDISKEIIGSNTKTLPEYLSFYYEDIRTFELEVDYTICLDVLIHVPRKDDYYAMLDNLVKKTRKKGIINGFKIDLGNVGNNVWFHEDIAKSLERLNVKIVRSWEYRSTQVIEWSK